MNKDGNTMQEIRFHGRGGQGTVVASVILAKAFFYAGYWVQTFPVFGVERRGAPVEAYLRISNQKIRIRSNIYTPDHIVVQDAKLIRTVDVTKGQKKGGWVILNASDAAPFKEKFSEYRLALIDASSIALKHHLGTRTYPIINTSMVGAFARILGNPPLEAVIQAIREEISVKPDQNIAAATEAYEKAIMC